MVSHTPKVAHSGPLSRRPRRLLAIRLRRDVVPPVVLGALQRGAARPSVTQIRGSPLRQPSYLVSCRPPLTRALPRGAADDPRFLAGGARAVRAVAAASRSALRPLLPQLCAHLLSLVARGDARCSALALAAVAELVAVLPCEAMSDSPTVQGIFSAAAGAPRPALLLILFLLRSKPSSPGRAESAASARAASARRRGGRAPRRRRPPGLRPL